MERWRKSRDMEMQGKIKEKTSNIREGGSKIKEGGSTEMGIAMMA